ncbi:hypothetical protein [Oculatella sp. FACHB-28]|uniref:hypothetical protein n=1 Tax=Oculatella sp. FACHB-28 TaxID=2692845 RepID=UPI001F553901|nr:hypothetical protein [Oculatella sp. FACHB-28]
MRIKNLLKLKASSGQPNKHHEFIWLCLSLMIPLYFGLLSLQRAFSAENVVQDDARHHVVWLQRYIDPQLFPNDLIAHYFQTLAPAGFRSLYWMMAKLGIEPLLLAKILPVILALITSAYIFKAYLRLLPIPAGAFLAVLLLNQTFWLKDDIASATPRAFVYPLFAAFLYYLLRRSLVPCLITIALQGLFFPQLLLVEITILTVRLINWQNGLPRLTQEKHHYIVWLFGLGVAALVVLPFTQSFSGFGEVVTASQMKAMPEFGSEGRSKYFGVDPLSFILSGSSGLRAPDMPYVNWISLSLPIILKSQLPLVRSVTREIRILWQILFASLGVFLLAHLVLLKLYFPSRYTYHSLRFVMPIAAAIALTVLFHASWRWLQQNRAVNASGQIASIRSFAKPRYKVKHYAAIGMIGTLFILCLVTFALPAVALNRQQWVVGRYPEIYDFFANQPKDTLIASLVKEANSFPAFSQRSILAGEEFAFAYHPSYYNQFKQHTIDTIYALYSSDSEKVEEVIQSYGIDFFVVENTSFQSEFLKEKKWLIHSSFQPVVLEAIAWLERGEKPVLQRFQDQCSVLSERNLTIIDANCITISDG